MTYIRNMVGSNETLIGVARLHWVYILKGLFAFTVCLIFGWAIDSVAINFLSFAPDRTESSYARPFPHIPFLGIGLWILPISIVFGCIILAFYVMKVFTTEVGMTNTRIIHKTGWIFVKAKEIDIEEISGANVDKGYFGMFLGYGYIFLDCRFIGDVALPAISHAEAFIKALNKVRAGIHSIQPDEKPASTPDVIGEREDDPDDQQSADNEKELDMLKPQEPHPNEKELLGDKPDDRASDTQAMESKKEILMLEIENLELKKEILDYQIEASNETHADAPPAPHSSPDEKSVEDIIEQVVPAIVEKVLEDLKTSDALPHEPPEEDPVPVAGTLHDSFIHASTLQNITDTPTAPKPDI